MRAMRLAGLGVVLAGLLTIAAGPPPEAERFRPGGPAGWLVDAVGGCWIWVAGIDATAEGLETRWNGACPNGPAEGDGTSSVRWRSRGQDRSMDYAGGVRAGKNEGRGRLVHTEAGEPTVIEDGEFRDDRFVGGRFEVRRAGLVHEGPWRSGHPHGPGRATLNGRVFEGDWEFGCLKLKEGGWMAFTRPPAACEGSPA